MLFEKSSIPIGKKSPKNQVLVTEMNSQIRHYISAMVRLATSLLQY